MNECFVCCFNGAWANDGTILMQTKLDNQLICRNAD